MGCDIHSFAEKRIKPQRSVNPLKKSFWVKPTERWEKIDFGEYEMFPGYWSEVHPYIGWRNYNLFAALCGVRSEHFTNEVKPVAEPRGFPPDISEDIQRVSDEWGSDGHSHSYNTLKELKEYDWSPWGNTCDEFIHKTIPELEKHGGDEDVRFVYFFDN